MSKDTNRAIIIVLSAVLVILLFVLKWSCGKIKDSQDFETMYNASMDSLHKQRDELGREKTTTALLYGDIKSLKALNSSKDSTLKKLQEIVNKRTISATIFSTSTGNTVSTGTTSVTGRDTVWKDSLIYIYPEYATAFKNRWEDFNIKANKDTFLLKYKIFNEYEFTQEWKRQGIFKPRTPVVTVTNQNPNTETIELKSFTVKPDKRSRWKNIALGAVAGFGAGYVIFKK